jgi:tetratricopeptide (TPR) repeat protein
MNGERSGNFWHPATLRVRVLMCLLLLNPWLRAQPAPEFEKASLALRTALHFDPGSESSLRSLVELHQKAGRVAELIGLYEQHITQYPSDENAAVVFARLLLVVDGQRAGGFLEQALKKFPGSALLKHTQFEALSRGHDPFASRVLDEAVGLEIQVPSRRSQWLAKLIQSASGPTHDDLVAARMTRLVSEGAVSEKEAVQWVRRCLDADLKRSADAAAKVVRLERLGAEEAVEARFVLARCSLVNGRREEAAGHAAALLDLLAPEHWRWREAQMLFWQSADENQRTKALTEHAGRWKAMPSDEVSALTYGDILELAGRREEALKVWREAMILLPSSSLLEERVTGLLRYGGQEEELLRFLTSRLESAPDRTDLRLQKARQLLLLGRMEEGRRELDMALNGKDAGQKAEVLLLTARWLRQQNLFQEASGLLESVISTAPQRWDVRKELAELYFLLKRGQEAEKLFEVELAEEVPVEVALEVAHFLVSRKLWPSARRMLETWIQRKPDAFDARLLLAKVESLAGNAAAAGPALESCRQLCDTDARYTAWLAVAWERAVALERETQLLGEERLRLRPAAGAAWSLENLRRLGILAEQTLQASLQNEAEQLLRDALSENGVPDDVRGDLRQLLIRVLDHPGAAPRVLEKEIERALSEVAPGQEGDLQLRLALMYRDAGRPDLARGGLDKLVPGQCQDASLLQKAVSASRELGRLEKAAQLAERLVRLQPVEKAHWRTWTGLLLEAGDESSLRLALREMDARAGEWRLDEEVRVLLRRHLAASVWRTVAAVLADSKRDSSEALLCLVDLEKMEDLAEQRGWWVWARALLARRTGDSAAVAEARAALAGEKSWIRLPDGLSLSAAEAVRILESPPCEPRDEVGKAEHPGDYSRPGAMAWRFSAPRQAGLLSWCLSPDGSRIVIQDAHRGLYALDRVTGKLVWQTRLQSSPAAPVIMNNRSGEELVQPLEWCLNDERVCVLHEDALFCLDLRSGRLAWKVPVNVNPARASGVLARSGDRVLWWTAALGTLDALDMDSGRLLWSQKIPQLGQRQPMNPGNPVWLMSGMRVDSGRAMVWGNGTAVVDVEKGTLLWKASSEGQALGFPLNLDGSDLSLASAGYHSAGSLRASYQGAASPVIMTSALAVPSFGYPGMFGGAMSNSWLLWGGDGDRWLQGDGIWLLGQNLVTARYSVFGFPQGGGRRKAPYYMNSATALGTAGRSLIVQGDRGLARVLPDGSVSMIATLEVRDNSPARHPLPAAGMDGSVVAVATGEGVQVYDGLGGGEVMQHAWSNHESDLLARARGSLRAWNSLRQSSRGLAFYDGRGKTQMVDWRALVRGGDVIFPGSTDTLFCYRCGEAGAASADQGQRRVTNDQAR